MQVNELARTVEVTFFEVIITGNSVGEKGMKIYDENKNIFTLLEFSDVDSAIEALKKEALLQSCVNGLFEKARKNGEMVMQVFL